MVFHPLLDNLCAKKRSHPASARDLIMSNIAVQVREPIVGDVVVILLLDILNRNYSQLVVGPVYSFLIAHLPYIEMLFLHFFCQYVRYAIHCWVLAIKSCDIIP